MKNVEVTYSKYNNYLDVKLGNKRFLKLLHIVKKIIILGRFPHNYSYLKEGSKIIQKSPGYKEYKLTNKTQLRFLDFGTAYFEDSELVFFEYE